MRRPGVGKIVRQGRCWGYRVEQGGPGDPVIPVVEVALSEEHSSGVVATDDLGTEPAHSLHQGAPEVIGIGELTIEEAEVLDAGQADERRRRLELGGALRGQFPGLDGRVRRPLAAVRAHHQMHGAPRFGPAGEGPAAGDVGIVGVGIDGQDDAGRLVHHFRFGSVVLVNNPASRWKSPASSKPL